MSSKVGTLRILVVDGDQAYTDAFVQRFATLKDFTASVEVSCTGADMLERVYRSPIDVVFLSMSLPDLDGLEVLSRLSQTTLPLPLVMMGADTQARQAVEAMKRGILDYLVKDDLLALDLSGLLSRLVESFRLRRENAELMQINQMKDDFLATISHELRTPLTSILGLSEVLLTGRMGALEERQAQSLKKILDQSHVLVKLINQLLDIRQLTQGQARLDAKPVSVQDLVLRQGAAMQTLFEKKGVKLVLDAGDDACFAAANAENLSKVVEHLIANGIKFTPKDGSVRVEVRKLDTGHVQFKVKDTGRGIPSESLPYVFQKFFHVDKSLTRPYGGMGLGLAYCKEVVEAHAGRIWVESKGTGQGTLVSFLLPGLRDPEPAPKDGKPVPSVKPAPTRKTVLWVDDNPNLLELVEYGFAGFQHPVNLITAQGGVAAVAKLKTQIPDLVVLDIMMADMDGLELLDRLKADPQMRDIPVLVVSGYKEAAKIAVERGATDFSLKPFRLQDVLKKIENLLFAASSA
jgi:signal transduction histidine kinase